jgi:hypothetical protein
MKDERTGDLFYDIIFLDPVTTGHISKIHLIRPDRRSRSSHFRMWWAAFGSYIGQMFDTTRDQMNNWRWDNPCTIGDQANRSNLQTTSSGRVKRTSERFSWYGSHDLWAKIQPPSCRQYQPGDCLAGRLVNWDEIIDKDDDNDNWADTGATSTGPSRPGDNNDNDHGDGEEDTQGGKKGTAKGKGAKDRKGKGKGNGKGNCEGKGIVKGTLG